MFVYIKICNLLKHTEKPLTFNISTFVHSLLPAMEEDVDDDVGDVG